MSGLGAGRLRAEYPGTGNGRKKEKAHSGKAVRFFVGGKGKALPAALQPVGAFQAGKTFGRENEQDYVLSCLLYTSDAAAD